MSKRIAFAVLLSAAALAGCAANDRVGSSSSSSDLSASSLSSLDGKCSAVAETGDMYRYCLQVGPQQALLEVDGGTATTATAALTDSDR